MVNILSIEHNQLHPTELLDHIKSSYPISQFGNYIILETNQVKIGSGPMQEQLVGLLFNLIQNGYSYLMICL